MLGTLPLVVFISCVYNMKRNKNRINIFLFVYLCRIMLAYLLLLLLLLQQLLLVLLLLLSLK